MKTFKRLESEVRSYSRAFPTVFCEARGSTLIDERGKPYIDFFAGAGALNYGHNPPELKKALLGYLAADSVIHSLDMATTAKRRFLQRFEEVILKPRGLEYKMAFGGPTGTNAVEMALKLARKITGRNRVVSFTNGFHGMTLGSLALTGNGGKRDGSGVALTDVSVMPFDGYLGDDVDTIEMIEKLLLDPSSGVDLPAAFIVETVQAEGGIRPASYLWLQKLTLLARRIGALMIIDDIQVGCGRTGPFFSFEPAGMIPDVICLSKSLSGFGLPLSMVLIRPELDQFEPGEHNGTFRGHMPAFVTATAALDYWTDTDLTRQVRAHGETIASRLKRMIPGAEVRGRGMIQGLDTDDPVVASKVQKLAFERGLIIETAGARDEVLKVLPPLTIADSELQAGLDVLSGCIADVRGAVQTTAQGAQL